MIRCRVAGRPWTAVTAAFALLTVGAACERIVEVRRPFFRDPPAAAAGVLGYDDEPTKLTVCGNCHIGQQGGWKQTAHADAFARLGASPQESCADCHAVTERGNASEAQIGWAATRDSRYRDVQCESCHGPGLQHVSNPDATQPLASLAVPHPTGGAGSLFLSQAGTEGCGECHSGAHQPIVEEWAQSPHAEVVPSPAGNAACQQCHRGQQILLAWGEDANYKEKNSPEHLPITCGVCHDAHSGDNPGQLRFPVTTPAIEQHLCARCHNRRTAPVATSVQGLRPHAPESALLIGDAGWFPPGVNFSEGQILGTHGTERNPRLCATCHLPKFQIGDPLRAGTLVEATSHLFRPIPCVDAQGRPLPFGQSCDLTPEARSFKSCTGSGCHGTEQTAFSALTSAMLEVQRAADQLIGQLQRVDPNLGAAGGEIDPTNPVFTVAEGAFFNYNLATFGSAEFGTNSIVGSTVHNPFLIRALLIASIQAVQDRYGVAPSIVVDWDAELERAVRSSVR